VYPTDLNLYGTLPSTLKGAGVNSGFWHGDDAKAALLHKRAILSRLLVENSETHTNRSYNRREITQWLIVQSPAVGGKGLLFQEYNYIDGATQPDLVRTYGYDSHPRLNNLSTDIAHEGVFTQRTTFDRYGRTFQQFAATDPIAGEEFNYNAYDYLNQVIEAGNSANTTHVYREIIAMDARGNITEEIKGGIRTTRAYHADTGRIMGISALADFVQNLGYDFDVAGNLTARTDLTNGNNLSETFTYDNLNRLKTSTSLSGQTVINSLSLSYDHNGNILTKSNVEGG